jgi:hypothetical protein
MSVNNPIRNNYQTIAATSSSTWGAAGAYIHSVVVNVSSNTEASAILSDNGVALVSTPPTLAAGVYTIPLGIATKGAITARCSQNSNMQVIGLFSTYA